MGEREATKRPKHERSVSGKYGKKEASLVISSVLHVAAAGKSWEMGSSVISPVLKVAAARKRRLIEDSYSHNKKGNQVKTSTIMLR